MIVKTGYGYIKDAAGNIVSKYEFPIGEHSLSKGYTQCEVATKEELDDIKLYTPPKSDKQIAKEGNRASAIEKLGKLGFTTDEIEALIG